MQWYEDDVKAAITERLSCAYEPKTIFYGSSSIRLWNKLYDDFDGFKPVNLGFGGSTIAACVWFFDLIVSPVRNPDTLILYAVIMTLATDGVLKKCCFFREFMLKFRKKIPAIPFYYISIKPSVSRMEIINEIVYTNSLIEQEINSKSGNGYFVNVYNKMLGKDGKPIASYFEEDGLHLSRDGYIVWRKLY